MQFGPQKYTNILEADLMNPEISINMNKGTG